ncbi:hypothetical protein MTO96_034981 [Rhipicephalus appendiculatus]
MSSDADDEEPRPSSDEMDEKRQLQMAYLYLCHLEETRLWLSSCIEEELPSATRLEESLRNGVYLARLSHFFAPDEVPLRRIYDVDQSVHRERGLCFRHTDNINHWLNAMRAIGFPEHFFPDPIDLYERKNLPKVIYCLHALSLYLFKLGRAPRIEKLTGKLHFSDEEVEQVRRSLVLNAEVPMPAFGLIDGILAKETSADSSAVIAINTAIDKGEVRPALRDSLGARRAVGGRATGEHAQVPRGSRARQGLQAEAAFHAASTPPWTGATSVLFRELLLTRKDLGVHDIVEENVPAYFQVLTKVKEDARENNNPFTLSRSDLQVAVQLGQRKGRRGDSTRGGHRGRQHVPGLRLPRRHPGGPARPRGTASGRVPAGRVALPQPVRVHTARGGSSGNFESAACLENPHAHIADVRPQCHDRYVAALRAALRDRPDDDGGFLTHTEIQDIVHEVNAAEDGEADREEALERINDAVTLGKPAGLCLNSINSCRNSV